MPGPTSERGTTPAGTDTPRAARILFVDDDKSGRELSRYNLEEGGYAVDLAGDGAEALELFAADRHDLVVTDLRMPRVPGMELLRRIKEQGPDIPVVVITAHGNVETVVWPSRSTCR